MDRIVIGASWGDEGKGAVVDRLAVDSGLVVRYNGGDNAGHTMHIGDQKVVLHILPTGVLHGKPVAIGPDVFVNPKALLTDIEEVTGKGFAPKQIFIDERAHLIMPYHQELDAARDKNQGIGTTKRGIGPVAEARANRKKGLTVGDLFGNNFRERTKEIVLLYGEELRGVAEGVSLEEYADALATEYLQLRETLSQFITLRSTVYLLEEYENILFEGAQGTLLDVVHGTRPYITSSNTTAGAVASNVRPGNYEVVGIVKALWTRVGEGPFPTEMDSTQSETMRVAGDEFGATTGRGRRIGHPDFVALKYSALINGVNYWVLTKVDSFADTAIQGCTAYTKNGESTSEIPANMDGWEAEYTTNYQWPKTDWKSVTKETLPDGLRKYIADIHQYTGVPVGMITFGPERGDYLWLLNK